MMFRVATLLVTLVLATAGATRTSVTRRRLDEDISFLSGYKILYEGCSSGDSVALFSLCPSAYDCEHGCSGGGQYSIDLLTFVDSWTEASMHAREYACEMAREECGGDNEDGYDEDCYASYNFEDGECLDEDEDGEDEFNMQEWLECKQVEDSDYYVGPYCSGDNFSIYLGVFSDEDCTTEADVDEFENTVGYTLPYSSEAIVTEECTRCNEHGAEQDKNDGDEEDADDVLEQCEELYEESDKCESDLAIDNPDESGCEYIEQLQQETGTSSSSNGVRSAKKRTWWIILLLIALAAAGFAIYRFLLKREKAKKADAGPSDERLVSA